MEEFKEIIADLLEVNYVNLGDKFVDFDCWDSMTILSIIAFCSEEYQISISNDDINKLDTIESLFRLIENRRSTKG